MWVEIDGHVVTETLGGVVPGGVSITTEVGQRQTGTIDLAYAPNVPYQDQRAALQLPAGVVLVFPRGDSLDLETADDELPPFWADIAVDHPTQCYRAAVMARAPWCYWRLDEGATTRARDATANGRHGTYSDAGIVKRAVEPPSTGVPYGAAVEIGTGSIAGPALATLDEPYSVVLLVWIDAAAAGAAELVRVGNARLSRISPSAGVHHLAFSAGSVEARLEVSAEEWLHVACVRESSGLRLHVGSRQSVTLAPAFSASDTATAALSVHGSGPALNCRLDELAVLPEVLTAAAVADLRERVPHARMFGGKAYAPVDLADPAGGRQIRVRAIGYWGLLDRLHVEGVWASATDQAVSEVVRDILTAAAWPYSADGCDKDSPIGRVVGRVAPASELIRAAAARAATLAWGDAWGDIHLDTAGELRRLPITLDSSVVAPGWKRQTVPTRWRTRTIVLGAGVPGALIPETFIGDGSRRVFDLAQQVREVRLFRVAGADVDLADSASGWALGPEKITLQASVAPAANVEISIQYVSESPLVAAASDPVGLLQYGRVERRVEDASLDTAAAVQERAVTEQAAHGRPGLEVLAKLKPSEQPLLHDVGGAPIVRLGSLNQRMLVERLRTGWQPGGRRVVQGATLRAYDYSSDLDQRSRTRVLQPTVTVPPAAPTTDIAITGLDLPVEFGGNSDYWLDDAAWVPVPDTLWPILDGHLLSEIDLVVSCMARVAGELGATARLRLWDLTRGVRVGDELEVQGAGAVWRQLHGIRLAPQRSQLQPQQRVVTATAAVFWGIRLSPGS